MTETENGGLAESAATPVSDDMPPHERIAGWIESDDHATGPAPEGGQGDRNAVDEPNTSPRSWGFDVEEINRSYAVAIWGGKTVVVNTGCSVLEAGLRAWGYTTIATELDEFLKAGGSAKCLTLRLDGEEAARW